VEKAKRTKKKRKKKKKKKKKRKSDPKACQKCPLASQYEEGSQPIVVLKGPKDQRR